MANEKLKGGLQTLLNRNDNPTPPPATEGQTEPSQKEELRNTIKDPELKEALQNEEELKAALRAKRFAGGRPKKGETKVSQTRGYGRTCIVANEKKMDKIREIAFRETLTIKQIFEAMMDNLISSYEAKHGEIIPADHSGDPNKLFD